MADTLSVSADVAATPHEVFEFVRRPANHAEINGDGTVKGSVQGPEALGLGDRFGMHMKLVVPYRVTSKVVEFEPDSKIAWCHLGGHRWRWEVEPAGDHAASRSPTTRRPRSSRPGSGSWAIPNGTVRTSRRASRTWPPTSRTSLSCRATAARRPSRRCACAIHRARAPRRRRPATARPDRRRRSSRTRTRNGSGRQRGVRDRASRGPRSATSAAAIRSRLRTRAP